MLSVPEWQRPVLASSSSEDDDERPPLQRGDSGRGDRTRPSLSSQQSDDVLAPLGTSASSAWVPPTAEEMLGEEAGGTAIPPGSVLARIIARAEVAKPIPGRAQDAGAVGSKGKGKGRRRASGAESAVAGSAASWKASHAPPSSTKSRRWTSFIRNQGAPPGTPVRTPRTPSVGSAVTPRSPGSVTGSHGPGFSFRALHVEQGGRAIVGGPLDGAASPGSGSQPGSPHHAYGGGGGAPPPLRSSPSASLLTPPDARPGLPMSPTRMRLHRRRQTKSAVDAMRGAALTALAAVRIKKFARKAIARRLSGLVGGGKAGAGGGTPTKGGTGGRPSPPPRISTPPTDDRRQAARRRSVASLPAGAAAVAAELAAPHSVMILRRPDPRSNLAGETPLFALFKRAVQTGRLPPVSDAASVFTHGPGAALGHEGPGAAARMQEAMLATMAAGLPAARRPRLVHAVCMYDAARYRSLRGQQPNPAVGPLRRLFDNYARLFSAGAQLAGMGKEALTYDMRAYARKTMSKGEMIFLLRDVEVLPQLVSRNEVAWIFDRRTHPVRMPHAEIRARPGAGARAVAALAADGPQAGEGAGAASDGHGAAVAGMSAAAAAAAIDAAASGDPIVEELGWTLDDATVEDQLRQGDMDFRRFCRLFVRIALFAMSKPSIALSGLGTPSHRATASGRPALRRAPGDDAIPLPGEEEDLALLPAPSDAIDPITTRASPAARRAFEELGITPALASRRVLASPASKVRRFLRHTRLVSPKHVAHLLATVARETDDLLNAPGPPPSDMDRSSYLPQQSSAVTSAKRAVAALHARRTRLANARGALLADGEGRFVDSQWRGGASASTVGALHEPREARRRPGRSAPSMDPAILGVGRGGGGGDDAASVPSALGAEDTGGGWEEALEEGGGYASSTSSSDDDLAGFGAGEGWGSAGAEEGKSARPWGGAGGPYPDASSAARRSGQAPARSSRKRAGRGAHALADTAGSRGVRFAGAEAGGQGREAAAGGGQGAANGVPGPPPDALSAAAEGLNGTAALGITRSPIVTRGFAAQGEGVGGEMRSAKRGAVRSEEEEEEAEMLAGLGGPGRGGGRHALSGTAAGARSAAELAMAESGRTSGVWEAVPASGMAQGAARRGRWAAGSVQPSPMGQRRAHLPPIGPGGAARPGLGSSASTPALGGAGPKRRLTGGAGSEATERRWAESQAKTRARRRAEDGRSSPPQSPGSPSSTSSRHRRGGHSFQRQRRNSPPKLTTAGATSAGYVESAMGGRLGGVGVGGVAELLSAGASVDSSPGSPTGGAASAHSAVPSSRSGRQAVQSAFHVGSTIVSAPLAAGGASLADSITVTAETAEHALELAGLWNADAVTKVHGAPVSDGLGNKQGGVRRGEWKGSVIAGQAEAAEAEARHGRARLLRSAGAASPRGAGAPADPTDSLAMSGPRLPSLAGSTALSRRARGRLEAELAAGAGGGSGSPPPLGATTGGWKSLLLSSSASRDTVATRTWREGAAGRLLGGSGGGGGGATVASSASLTGGPSAVPLGPEHASRLSYDPRLLGLLTSISQDPNARRWTYYAPAVGEAFMDFGRVLVGKTYGYRLELRNTSGDTVRVHAAKRGIPGLQVRYRARPAAAGRTVLVDLQLRAAQASETIGHVVVTVTSSSGASERLVCPCYLRAVQPGSVAARLADLPPAVGVVPLTGEGRDTAQGGEGESSDEDDAGMGLDALGSVMPEERTGFAPSRR